MRIRYWSILATVLLVAAGTALAADSPWAGKWKLDPSQSKITGDTIQFTSNGDDITYTAQGHTTRYKLGGGPTKSWEGDETSWKKIDDNTYESHTTVNGVDIDTETWTISPDGKNMKIEAKGKRPDGSSLDNVAEYQRVNGTHGLSGSWRNTKRSLGEEQTYDISDKGPDELSWNIPAIKGVLDVKLDGKDYAPVGPTVPKGLTIALAKTGPRTLKFTEKMNGTPVVHSTMTVSEDGQKITEVGSDAKTNEPFTEVWIKQ
jgi:hypothetical protein